MGEILVGVDGSDSARAALRWGAAIAEQLGRGLRVVWVWSYPADTVAQVQIDLPPAWDMDRRTREQLDEFVADTVASAAPQATLHVRRGHAVEALLQEARRDVDMIVVGSRGLGGFRQLLLGSVSGQLCEYAPCPVVVVRDDTVIRPGRLATVVVGVDGSPGAARALRWAASLAQDADAEVVLAHAAMSPRQQPRTAAGNGMEAVRAEVERWAEALSEHDVPYRIALAEGDPRLTLLEIADRETADLLVVGSRGRGSLAGLTLGSVARELAQHSERPITIVPPTARTESLEAPMRARSR